MAVRKKFGVVEFIGEKTVEVVPSNWIRVGNRTCAFPQGPKSSTLRKDPNCQPEKNWPIYSIRLRYTTDSFEKADKRADHFQFTSTFDSYEDSSSEDDSKRKKNAQKTLNPSLKKPTRRQKKNKAKEVSRIPSTVIAGILPIYQGATRLEDKLVLDTSASKLNDIPSGHLQGNSQFPPGLMSVSSTSSGKINPIKHGLQPSGLTQGQRRAQQSSKKGSVAPPAQMEVETRSFKIKSTPRGHIEDKKMDKAATEESM